MPNNFVSACSMNTVFWPNFWKLLNSWRVMFHFSHIYLFLVRLKNKSNIKIFLGWKFEFFDKSEVFWGDWNFVRPKIIFSDKVQLLSIINLIFYPTICQSTAKYYNNKMRKKFMIFTRDGACSFCYFDVIVSDSSVWRGWHKEWNLKKKKCRNKNYIIETGWKLRW